MKMNKAKIIKKLLEEVIKEKKEIEERFIKDIQKNSLVYAMEWAAGKAGAVYLGNLAERVLKEINKHPKETENILEDFKKQMTNDLLNNSFGGGSTSAFHNATDKDKQEAVSLFLRNLR